MNVLATDQRAQILNCLVEGCSMRSTTRLTGAAKKTVERLLISAGKACAKYQDRIMRNLNCKVLQVDEVWSFTYAKQKNVPEHLKGRRDVGDTWTWIALDSKSKLVPCWHVGKRDASDAYIFINDLAGRLASRVQLTSDGLRAYVEAVEGAFGSEIDFAQLVKLYGTVPGQTEARYSPPVCTGTRRRRICGEPDRKLISTSHIERQNLTLRMNNRRFTRLTNGYSKKLENHKHMMAIHFMAYIARDSCNGSGHFRPRLELGRSRHPDSISPMEKVAFWFADETPGTVMTICDVLDCEEKRWLVTRWLDNPATGKTRPERMICISRLQHQKIEGREDYCYLLTLPMPRAVFDGKTRGLHDGQFFLVANNPDVELDKPSLLQ